YSRGRFSSSAGSPTLKDVTVSGNTASSGGGLYIDAGSPTLTRVTVSRNLGAGLYFSSGGGALVNVTITGNTSGIYIESGAPTIAGSNIAYHGTGLYNADNTYIIDADSIWWGDPSGPYHPTQNPGGLGDSVNAFVDIIPFLTEPDTAAPPIPVQNLVVTNQGDDFVELAWNASPIGDLAGYRIYLDTDSTGFPYADTVDVGNSTSSTLSNLEPGLTYFIAATCYDTDGNESWYSREVAASVSPVPRIAVSSSTIDFDVSMVGATTVVSLLVSNTGTADLNVSQILSGDPRFVASPSSFTVPVGGQQDVTVSFMPSSYGMVSDTLTIISDAFNDPELPILVQGFGDLPEAPVILSIVDVDDPPDQGGQVRINFARSKYDGLDTSQTIASYSIWRHIESDEWDAVGQFDAIQDSIYHYVAPTLCDSTWEGICWSIFKISAHAINPDTFYFSQPDSGYSIDNIAPGVPTGLLAAEGDSGAVLTWHQSTETDFQFYAVYRSTQPGFDPDTMGTFFFSTADTHFVDTEVQASNTYYYRISAFDHAGNESGFSDEVSVTILGVSSKYEIPSEYALHPGYPNPFNPSITLPFDLPEGAPVFLAIYDLMGREVIRLAHGDLTAGYHQVVWNGKDADGRTLPTGIYIAKLTTPGYTKSIKMLLLK
ncbi:MAG: fibronectin type III domain-containing protein, partial [Candidatus Marinimicrobia bacterium]|nr:fibronectin type III domain-containing protein [Candidatus Neomarinimicrobiota bacterium]